MLTIGNGVPIVDLLGVSDQGNGSLELIVSLVLGRLDLGRLFGITVLTLGSALQETVATLSLSRIAVAGIIVGVILGVLVVGILLIGLVLLLVLLVAGVELLLVAAALGRAVVGAAEEPRHVDCLARLVIAQFDGCRESLGQERLFVCLLKGTGWEPEAGGWIGGGRAQTKAELTKIFPSPAILVGQNQLTENGTSRLFRLPGTLVTQQKN